MPNAKDLTQNERNFVYNKLTMELMKLGLDNSKLYGIKRLKVIAKLWKDTGREDNGEIELPRNQRITYEFWKDHRRQTNVYISRGAGGLKDYKEEENEIKEEKNDANNNENANNETKVDLDDNNENADENKNADENEDEDNPPKLVPA
jgi:hypothetical protein